MKLDEMKKELAKKVGVTIEQAGKIISEFCDIIKQELVNGGELVLQNFGTFKVKFREERPGPVLQKSGTPTIITEGNVPKFKPAEALKKAVKAGKAVFNKKH